MKVKKYHGKMRKLASFLHNSRCYLPGHKWLKREFLAYLLIKVYGDDNANPGKVPPLHHRRNSVLFWKKAWSYFILDNNHQWSKVID